MRGVSELVTIGFQASGETLVRQEASFRSTVSRPDFAVQSVVYPDGTTWDRLYIYVTHPDSQESVWFGYNDRGQQTDRGGNPDTLARDAMGADSDDEDADTDIGGLRPVDALAAEIRTQADATASRVVGALG
jgi:hypothetical protein